MTNRDLLNPVNAEAIQIAQAILSETRYGALAVAHPDTHTPYVARVALLWHGDALLTLVSTLSHHTTALAANADCAALVGEPKVKGDPLTHPRMTLICKAEPVQKATHRTAWLGAIPKAKLYFDFSDFVMFQLGINEAHLNGGFGKAYRLSRDDLVS